MQEMGQTDASSDGASAVSAPAYGSVASPSPYDTQLRVTFPCRRTSTTSTSTKHLASLDSLHSLLRRVHVSRRLSLMFLIPCHASLYWKTVGGIGLIWLVLPKLRIIVVSCLRQPLRLLQQPALPAAFFLFRTTRSLHPRYYDDDDSDSIDSDEEGFTMTMESSLLPSLPPAPSASPLSSSPQSPRRSTIQPIKVVSVHDILASGGPNSPIRALPIGRLGDASLPSSASTTNTSPPLRTPPTPQPLSAMSNDSVMSPLRDGSQSIAQADRQTKRLSLNFPIQPPSSRPSRPPSWHASPILSPEVLASPTEGNFLTVLAAQERRVLELRDELRRAEEELHRLKRHWAGHEISRKRQDIRRLHQLKPIRTDFSSVTGTDDDLDGSQQWLQKEMDRRKALLSGTRSSNRKVFSGSKHTRTLSLLSPDKYPPPPLFNTNAPKRKTNSPPPSFPRPKGPERSSTTPDVLSSVTSPIRGDNLFSDVTGVPKDAILRHGKQMVGDIKDGLWTFLEDIRQATVGDEAISGNTNGRMVTPSRPPGKSSQTSKPHHDKKLARHSTALITSQPRSQPRMTPEALIDIGGTFWRDHGLEDSQTEAAALRRTASTRQTRSHRASTTIISTPQKPRDIEDGWDMWGTPVRTPASAVATHSPAHSSRASTTYKSSSVQEPVSPFTEDSETSNVSTSPSSPSSQQKGPFSDDDKDKTLTGLGLRIASPDLPVITSPVGAADMALGGESPWPTSLAKLTPGNLKRTASHLMNEWERSIHSASPDSGLGYGSISSVGQGGGSGDEGKIGKVD